MSTGPSEDANASPITLTESANGHVHWNCSACNLKEGWACASREVAMAAGLEHLEFEHEPLPERLELHYDVEGPIFAPDGRAVDVEFGDDPFVYSISDELVRALGRWVRTRRTSPPYMTPEEERAWLEEGQVLAARPSRELGRPVEVRA